MEKDIAKIPKNSETDIIVRIDDYGGKRGLTIREFVKSERYSGFTKSGTRIPADKFLEFREAINSINLQEMTAEVKKEEKKEISKKEKGKPAEKDEDENEDSAQEESYL